MSLSSPLLLVELLLRGHSLEDLQLAIEADVDVQDRSAVVVLAVVGSREDGDHLFVEVFLPALFLQLVGPADEL